MTIRRAAASPLARIGLDVGAGERARGGRGDRPEPLAALVSQQGRDRERALELLALARHGGRVAVPDPARDRDAADVLLRAVGRARVLEHEGPALRRQLRLAAAQSASLGGASHGGHDVPPHGARLLHRRLPGPSRAQLARRRRAPAGDAPALLHGLPAALGPARLLGRDRRAPTSPGKRRWSGDSIRFLLLGGTEIGQATLLRFYVLHVFVLPVVVLLLFAYHMWRIRKDGGLAAVEPIAERTNARAWLPPRPRRATRSSASRAAPASRHSPRPRSRRRTWHSPRPSWCDGSCWSSCSSST